MDEAIKESTSQYLARSRGGPKLIELEYGKIFKDTREARELSDYELQFMPAEELTTTTLADAKRFVARIEKYLRDAGVIE